MLSSNRGKNSSVCTRDVNLEEPPNRWQLFVTWLLESLSPAVPVVSTVGASSLKSPASVWLWAIVLVFALSNVAQAVPNTTSYQGYLENSEAEPLNATVDMTFALYDVVQEGSVLWTETHQGVVVTNGVFSLILGSGTPFDAESLEGERYLGITVGGDSEMSPRQKLTSGFFAMRAGVADSVGADSVDTESIADGAVTAEKIAVGSVTADKIVAGVTITAAERDKLEDLGTGGVDSNPTFDNVVVEEQLNVKKHLKVGENSIHLISTPGTASENEIYTPNGNLIIQPPAKNGKNVGIGTSIPKAKLDVKGVLKVSPIDTSKIPLSFWQNFNEGIYNAYDSVKHEGEISSLYLTGSQSTWDYSPLFIMGDDVIINQQQQPSSLQPGNVGIGLEVGEKPKSKLDVAGSVTIGSSYAGNNAAHANGLIVEGDVGIGTANPSCKLQVKGKLCADSIQTSGEVYGKIWYSNKFVWDQHDNSSSKKMIHSSKGVCFLTYIRGKFEGWEEYAYVNIESDGYWYLKGHSNQSAVRAEARCIGSPTFINIDLVKYGENSKYCDATTVFKQQCDNQQSCSVQIGNQLCGDPIPNIVKKAVITYSCDGNAKNLVVSEYQTAELNCN